MDLNKNNKKCCFQNDDPSGYKIFNKFVAANCNGKAEKEEKRVIKNVAAKFCGFSEMEKKIPCKRHRKELKQQMSTAGQLPSPDFKLCCFPNCNRKAEIEKGRLPLHGEKLKLSGLTGDSNYPCSQCRRNPQPLAKEKKLTNSHEEVGKSFKII